jgi:hypothetical protein
MAAPLDVIQAWMFDDRTEIICLIRNADDDRPPCECTLRDDPRERRKRLRDIKFSDMSLIVSQHNLQ